MSIRDFYAKFLLGNEDNSLLFSLRRLSRVEDASQFSGGGSSDPSGDWIVWQQRQAVEAQPALA